MNPPAQPPGRTANKPATLAGIDLKRRLRVTFKNRFAMAMMMVLFINFAGAAQAADKTALATRFTQLATQSARTARFVEIRQISELDQPIESRGELRFEPPATLVKQTIKPLAETLTLDQNRLSISIGGTTRDLPLSAVPAAAALAGALRGLLSGKISDVESHFSIGYRVLNDDNGWQMVLKPLSRTVANVLESITVLGNSGKISQLQIVQTNGDESVLQILADS